MSTEPAPPVRPRPGVVLALGICNVLFSVLSGLCVLSSGYMLLAVAMGGSNLQPAQVQVNIGVGAPPGPGVPLSAGFNPFVAMSEPGFLRFSIVESSTGLIASILMFATGIGLINRQRWAARWWGYLAWFKIFLAVALWGYFIIGVAPAFASSSAKGMLVTLQQQNAGNGRPLPSVADITQTFSVLFLVSAVVVMVFSAIYPAISLWLIRQRGFKAALVGPVVATEPDLS